VSIHSTGIDMFQVMKALLPFNNKFRVLALSATPGCNMQAVTQVCSGIDVTSVLLEPSQGICCCLHKPAVILIFMEFSTFI
jgi:ERCC4-related helicase